jgi:hypothetical protein
MEFAVIATRQEDHSTSMSEMPASSQRIYDGAFTAAMMKQRKDKEMSSMVLKRGVQYPNMSSSWQHLSMA